MMLIKALLLVAAMLSSVSSFQAQPKPVTTTSLAAGQISRDAFLESSVLLAGASLFVQPSPAFARGRATLDYTYDRYTPRITAGGQYYGGDLRKMIEKSDWNGIKLALQEPPKRTKEDKAKIDGGITERAAQAGEFSDSRVIVACDLFASAFSDNSISPKTKKMKEQVDILRDTVSEMKLTAAQALGEAGGGGLFGLGGKKPSQAELAKKIRQLYTVGGNAYNKYIFLANDELPLSLVKLPYLR